MSESQEQIRKVETAMSHPCSRTLKKQTDLLKECSDAYLYAVEVVTKNSVMAADLCQSCAEVCYNCADECSALEDDLLGKELYNMCMKYARLCEEIMAYHSTQQPKQLKETI